MRFAFCEQINQIQISKSIKCDSFKFKIFAINLNSTFEFHFQSIKLFVRRNDTNKFFKFDHFIIDFILFDIDDIINLINQFVRSSQILNIMTFFFTFEQRLIIFKKWFYRDVILIFSIDFYYKSNISLDYVECVECDLIINWKRDILSIFEHIKRIFYCFFDKNVIKTKKNCCRQKSNWTKNCCRQKKC